MSGLYARVIALPWVAPLKPNWIRSRQLADGRRFFANETAGRAATRTYSLRDRPDVRVTIRHGTPDVSALDQIFVQSALRPPPRAAEILAGLGRSPRVLDLGANNGTSAAWWSWLWPAARVVCVEPDRFNVRVLSHTAAQAGGRWRVIAAAATNAPGEVSFESGDFSLSRIGDGTAETVPAIDVFALADEERPDLLKIDIEGAEWPILADPRLATLDVPVITMEYHSHGCPAPDARAEALRRLADAGYEVQEVPHADGAPEDEGSLWAWRAA